MLDGKEGRTTSGYKVKRWTGDNQPMTSDVR